jgi:aminopeptidase-like protein
MALLWVLNLADGRHSLLEMSDRAGVPFETIRAAADALLAVELIEPIPAAALTIETGMRAYNENK